MRCVTDFGTYDVIAYKHRYYDNNNLAVELITRDREPFARLTVNLGPKLRRDHAFVDTNNCPWAPQFLQEHNLAKPVGAVGHSGFCDYPLYKFDLSKLEEY